MKSSQGLLTYLGSYTKEYARHRIVQAGLHELGVPFTEFRDQNFLPIRWWNLARILRTLPESSPIIIGEESNFLTPVLLEARRRKHPLIFDVFVSVREHLEDISTRDIHKLLYPVADFIDQINNQAASAVLLDTQQHKNYFINQLGLDPKKAFVAYVGAETSLFTPHHPLLRPSPIIRVLFYGLYHLIHGVNVIVQAAAEIQQIRSDIRFQLVGDGPMKKSITALVNRFHITNIDFGPESVPYIQLPTLIANADICLGLFGDAPKTRRVIPNKIFQCAAMGVPIITADTPAVREAFSEKEICLVPASDSHALAHAILLLADDLSLRNQLGAAEAKVVHEKYCPRMIASQVLKACFDVIA